jgi:hypothetical protein
MTLDEQDEFIQHIMANHDAAVNAASASMTQMGTGEARWSRGKSTTQILSDPAGE